MTIFGKCGIARIHSILTLVAYTRDGLVICYVNANVYVISYRIISYNSFCIKKKVLRLDIERPCALDAKYILSVAILTFIN
jgi:hypothetical protein